MASRVKRFNCILVAGNGWRRTSEILSFGPHHGIFRGGVEEGAVKLLNAHLKHIQVMVFQNLAF